VADCCLSYRHVSECLNDRFISGSSYLLDSEASGWSVPIHDCASIPRKRTTLRSLAWPESS
jgi:hypothetical protein